MEKFDLIVPFGSYCVTSYNLRAENLQTQSLPFDWIYNANLPLCIDLLQNNFKNFLAKDKLTYLRQDGKNFIFKNAYGVELIHDFKNEDLEVDYEEVAERYQRRINRLYQKIAQSNSILFVNVDESENYTEPQIAAYAQKLSSLYPEKNIKLLYIKNIKELKKIEFKKQSSEFDIAYLPIPEGDNVKGSKILKLYHKLFSEYRLHMEIKKNKFKKIQWFLAKSLVTLKCMFIASKKKRHRLRHEYINKLYSGE